MNSIFISLAAYRDPLLLQTMCEAAKNAAHPEQLVFGVVEQREAAERLVIPQGLQKQVRYVGVDPKDSRGVCWARSLAMSLYAGEDWFLQLDSHMLFDEGWDAYLLESIALCYQQSSRPILTGLPNTFEYKDGASTKGYRNPDTIATKFRDDRGFCEDGHTLAYTSYTDTAKQPIKAMNIAGAYVFAAGSIVEEVPYDPRYYFYGEEQSFSIRAYTRGWDIYHAPNMPFYHLYSTESVRGVRKHHWEKEQDTARGQRWWELDNASKARLTQLVTGKLSGVYGLGTERTLEDYFRDFGVDYLNRTIRS